MKKVLIVGKNSYIGESLYKWLDNDSNQFIVDIVSPMHDEWKRKNFKGFDSVVNFAGIAHINNIKKDMENLFYSVNRDLAIEIGEHAKDSGVKQFIQFSSMNVYGDYSENVKDLNQENPTSFYGDSKYQGDLGLKKLEDETFNVAYVRPPFVYGKGCKGNYNTISKISRKTPIFPTYKNKKSMIYIDNLCEFIKLLILDGSGGKYAPQNKELVSTYELVKEISKVNNHKVWFTGLFNWIIKPCIKKSNNVRRAFSNDCYEIGISNYYDFKYCVVDFRTSIEKTEI